MRRLAPAFVALALVAAGCGGGGSGGGDVAAGAGAEIVPATAPAFITVNSDLDSTQWNTVEGLLDKFPDGAELVASIRNELRDDSGLDYEQDVKPALGEEIGIVFLDFESRGANVVGVTQPQDEEKFRAMVAKGNAAGDEVDLLTAEVGDWTVIADSQAKLDLFRERSAGDKLADSSDFDTAVADLPDESLLSFYVNGTAATRELQDALEGSGAGTALAEQEFEWAVGALEAVSNGMRFEGVAKLSGAGDSIRNYSAGLLDDVPAGALAVLSFDASGSLESLERRLRDNPDVAGQLGTFEQALGASLNELLALFDGEGVLYVREASPIPEVTVLIEQADPAKAVGTLDAVAARAGILLGTQPTSTTIGSIAVKQLAVSDDVTISWAGFDGKLVVTNVQSGIEDVSQDGAKLGDDPAFEAASEAAQLPTETAGLLYVNLEDSIEVALRFAGLADEEVPPEVNANARALESLLVFASADGDETHFAGFLGIE